MYFHMDAFLDLVLENELKTHSIRETFTHKVLGNFKFFLYFIYVQRLLVSTLYRRIANACGK